MKKSVILLGALCALPIAACSADSSLSATSSTAITESSFSQSSEEDSASVSESSSSEVSSISIDPSYTESALWPAEVIADVLGEAGDVVVPAFETVEPFYYQVLTDSYGDYLDLFTLYPVITAEALYSQALTNAGWTIDDTYYDDYGYIAEDPAGRVDVQYYWVDGVFQFLIYQADGSGDDTYTESALWPSEAIAESLGESVTAVVPAYTSANPFYYMAETGFAYVFTAADSVASEEVYKQTLIDAGWTVDDSNYDLYGYEAYDPDLTIDVVFSWYDGNLEWFIMPMDTPIAYTEVAVWPSDVIVSVFGETEAALVPSYESANAFFYAVVESTDGSYIDIYTEADSIDSENAYKAALETLGWTIDDTYYDTYGYFAESPDGALYIQFYYWEGTFQVYIAPASAA